LSFVLYQKAAKIAVFFVHICYVYLVIKVKKVDIYTFLASCVFFAALVGAEKTASRHEANENILYHAEFLFFFIHNFFFDIILCVKLQNKPIEWKKIPGGLLAQL